MSNSETDREEKRFAEMLSVIESKAPSPDKAFLKRLKNQSTQVFLAGGSAQAAHERKTLMMIFKRFIPTAAAVCVVGAIAVVAFLMLGDGVATVAWADVQEIIRNARTATWHMQMTMTMPMPNGEMVETTMHVDCFAKEPGLMRQEMTMSMKGKEFQSTSVVDFSTEDGRMVSLVPSQKMAVTATFGNLPEETRNQQKNYFSELKKLVEGSNQPLGRKEIDGRNTQGFRVTNMGYEMDIWVDPETGLPVLIESEMFGTGKMTMTDFAFDVALDDELFDLTVPEGYTVREMDMPLDNITENDLIEGLRFIVELSDNLFPSYPMITPELMKNLMERAKEQFKDREPSEEEGMESGRALATKITRMMMFIQAKGGQTWAYVGEGVQLGDAQKPICWYKPEGSETYRVVYGDLRVEDVAEEDLPVVSAPVE